MVTESDKNKAPDWEALFATAESQHGYFTTAQAAEAGYSPQLLAKYLAANKIQRIRRGIYRLVHFPAMENEELVIPWLWSEQNGVLSHETALSLYGLSDLMPNKIHLTLPNHWRRRRLRIPEEVRLYYADIRKEELHWVGPVLVTSPLRTLKDTLETISPEFSEQAIQQAKHRGLINAKTTRELLKSLQGIE